MVGQKVNLPTLSVSKILKMRFELSAKLTPFIGQRNSGQDFDKLLGVLQDSVPSAAFSTLRGSFQHVAGVELTGDMADEIAWRVAGNAHRLKKGEIVGPWTQQIETEWVLAQVTDLTKGVMTRRLNKDSNEKVKVWGGMARLQLLSGSAAGKAILKFWETRYLLSGRTKQAFGFDRFDRNLRKRDGPLKKTYPIRDIGEYVLTRLWVLLEPAQSRDQPGFDQIRCTPTLIKYNRDLNYKRQRLSFVCPLAYSVADRPCHTCERGWRKCSAACHERDYVILPEPCEKCGKHDMYADLVQSATTCIDCMNRADLRY